jgi:hypothetical protein
VRTGITPTIEKTREGVDPKQCFFLFFFWRATPLLLSPIYDFRELSGLEPRELP